MSLKTFALIASSLVTVITVIMGYFEPFRLCGDNWRTCMDLNYKLDLMLFPFVPLFFFSLITYFMRDEVFKLWVKFALPATATSMLLIFLTKDSTPGGFGPQIAFGKGDVALATTALFVLISIGIIVFALIKNRRTA